MRKLWLVALVSMVVACGEVPSASSSASASPPDRPEQPVNVPAGSAATVATPTPVTPVGHTIGTRKAKWLSATPSGDGRTLRIVWWSGVEPCTVLDRVETAESADKVVVTLYEGHDSRSPDALCIDMAIQKTTTVTLKEPLGGRKVVDGAAS